MFSLERLIEKDGGIALKPSKTCSFLRPKRIASATLDPLKGHMGFPKFGSTLLGVTLIRTIVH